MLNWIFEMGETLTIYTIRSSFRMTICGTKSELGRILHAQICHKGRLIQGIFMEKAHSSEFRVVRVGTSAADPMVLEQQGQTVTFSKMLTNEIEFATMFLQFENYV